MFPTVATYSSDKFAIFRLYLGTGTRRLLWNINRKSVTMTSKCGMRSPVFPMDLYVYTVVPLDQPQQSAG